MTRQKSVLADLPKAAKRTLLRPLRSPRPQRSLVGEVIERITL